MTLFDDFNTPVIIISKKKNQILNKNTSTRQSCHSLLYKNNKAENSFFNKGNQRRSFKECSKYLDIFDDEINNLFNLHIEQCLSNITKLIKILSAFKRTSFIFPFKIDENIKYKENKQLITNEEQNSNPYYFFYEGKAFNYLWYTVTFSQCFWKAQEAIFVRI